MNLNPNPHPTMITKSLRSLFQTDTATSMKDNTVLAHLQQGGGNTAHHHRNPVGVSFPLRSSPRVASQTRQPWAGRRSPFGAATTSSRGGYGLGLASWVALLGVCTVLHLPAAAASAEAGPRGTESFRRSATTQLAIHEWGTFTALQDEQGRAIPGINTDDQPLPDFVHRLSQYLLIPANDLAPIFYKGAPQCHPDVTMRLETPVVYFYPPADAALPMRLSVRASFRGGWLTEYFPNAAADAPGVRQNSFDFGPLNESVRGKLEWGALALGVPSGLTPPLPETDSGVWLAPRAVRAVQVSAAHSSYSMETERYLFYRGVAHLDAPLRVVRSPSDGQMTVRPQIDERLGLKGPLNVRAMWLVDVKSDGTVAYRSFPSVSLSGGADRVLAKTAGQFRDAEFSKPNFSSLLAAMQTALVEDGLFEDEARALLKTWQDAYFKSPGMRLFFLVPREWTDAVLHLESSIPADISRTMVGRIELVSPEQRRLLAQLGTMNIGPSQWTYTTDVWTSPTKSGAIRRGEMTLEEAGLQVPPEYKAYLDLGRFRNALILDAQRQQPAPGLAAFAKAYGLSYFDTNR